MGGEPLQRKRAGHFSHRFFTPNSQIGQRFTDHRREFEPLTSKRTSNNYACGAGSHTSRVQRGMLALVLGAAERSTRERRGEHWLCRRAGGKTQKGREDERSGSSQCLPTTNAESSPATHVYLCGRVCVYVCVSSLCARAPADSCCKVLDNVMRVEYLTL